MSTIAAISHGARRDERGVAALELTLFFIVIFGLLALMAPLGMAIYDKNRLERSVGEAARFATQLPDRQHPGVAVGYRRASADEICADARREAADTGLVSQADASAKIGCTVTVNGAVVTGSNRDRPSGADVTVRLTYVADLGAFGGILSAVGIQSRTINISASALARQE